MILIWFLLFSITADFVKHFGQYGEIVDSVIMRDKHTSQPRGFGFITYSNPAVVDRVMDDIHEFNGKQVSFAEHCSYLHCLYVCTSTTFSVCTFVLLL